MRSLTIASTLFEYLVLYRLNDHHQKSFGQRLREACERLGPTFIKLGQLLSTRYELLKEEDCIELQRLLDQVPVMPPEIVRAVIRQDFGKELEELYSKFDLVPIASASIAQVHKAQLHDGSVVAVKVRRQHVHKIIRADIRVFKRLMRIAKLFSPTLRHVKILSIIDEYERWLLIENDFRHEAKNLDDMRAYYADYHEAFAGSGGKIICPNRYPDFCTRNILTMEFIDGVPLSKYRSIQHHPEYDLERSLRVFINVSIRALFQEKTYIFTADPHAANILILKGGDVAVVDFGLVERFDADLTRRTVDLFMAVYAKNVEAAIRAGLRLSYADSSYAERIRPDFIEYIRKAEHAGIGFWFMEVVRICIRRKVPLPEELKLFGRANTVLDGMVATVLPGRTTIELMGPELKRALRNRIMNNIRHIDYASVLFHLTEKVRESPVHAHLLIDRYWDNPLQFIRDVKKAVVE